MGLAPTSAHPRSERLGETFGRLTLLRPIGRGAHGEVFLAQDPDGDEEVALKVLHSRDPWALEGFKNEARFLCDLAHPALVAPTDLISHEGALALVMPYVAGRTFSDVLAEAAGPPDAAELADEGRVLRLVQGLVAALTALHERGLLHLDLKPDNVLVDEHDAVMLLDFGLARMRDAATRPGEVSGSAVWMAPEQLMLDAITAAADIYSAGLLVYAGLARTDPWNPADGLMARLIQPPRALAATRADMPAFWSELVHAMLAHEAIDRPELAILERQLAAYADANSLAPSSAHSSDHVTLPPFSGRAAELAQLGALLDGVFAGVPALARLHGEPGMGKTAVVNRFSALAAQRGAFVVHGRCFAAESIPFKALDAALDQLASRARADVAATSLLEQSADLPALARVFPIFRKFLAPSSGVEAPANSDDLARARALLRGFVQQLARTQPIVLVIEDLHWGDSDSVDALMALVEPPDAPRVLLVLTHRSGDVWTSSPFAMAFARRLEKGVPFTLAAIGVDHLTEADAHALAARALGAQAEAAIASVLAAAAGNALVLTRLLAEPDALGLDLPGLVARSMGRLEDDVQRFVCVTALAGRPLPVKTIARAAGVPIPTRATFAVLATQTLLRTAYEGSQRVAMPHHDLVRESIVAALSRADRTAAHRALADVLREAVRDEMADTRDDLGLVAFHLVAAGDTAAATPFALRAAEAAEQASAFARAADLLELVLAGDRHAGLDVRALQSRLARALREASRGHDAARVFGELAQSARDPAERRARLRAAADAVMTLGAVDQGLLILKPVLDELGIASDSGGVARTLRLAGSALAILTGRTRGIAAARASARAAERFDTTWPLAKALVFVDPLVGLDFMMRALEAAQASGDPERVARVTGPLAGFALGSIAGFKGIADRWVDQLGAHSQSAYLVAAEALWRAFLASGRGRLESAQDASERAIELMRSVEDAQWERVQAVSILGRVLVARGHFATALSLAQTHLPDAMRRGDLHAQVVFASYRLLPALAAGRPEETRTIADWTLRTWLPDRYSPQTFYALRGQRMTELLEGRTQVAAQTLATGRAAFEKAGGYRIVFSRFDHDLLEARTVLACDRMSTHGLWPLERLIERLEKLAMPEGAAHAMLLRASVAARAGDRNATLTWLARATHRLDDAGVDLEAQVARLRTAQLLGQSDPADAARLALRRLGVADPDRWADLLAPGYERLVAAR